VPLRTDDVQAAQFLDALHVFEILEEEFDLPIVDAIV
jgi:hypothetical protein